MMGINRIKAVLCAFFLSVGAFNASAGVDINKTYNDLYYYVQYWYEESSTFDVERAKSELDIVEAWFDDAKSVSPRGEEYRRTLRALTFDEINSFEKSNNNPLNVEQLEQAAADMHYVIEHGVNQYWVREFGYRLALLYTNFLEDEVQEAKAWLNCGESGHGGCINVLGSGYFSGRYGLPVDLEKSVFWHKKTIETGTRYRCAGIFSSFFLANVSHKFSTINTGKSWFEWVEVAQKLSEELTESNKDSEISPVCSQQILYIQAYAMAKSVGLSDQALIDSFGESALHYSNQTQQNRAKMHNTDEHGELPISPEFHIAQAVLQNGWEGVFEQIEQIENTHDKCSYALGLADLARAQKNRSALTRLDEYLVANEAQHCETPMQFRALMQENGTWNIQ